jgi:hypothetical protein
VDALVIRRAVVGMSVLLFSASAYAQSFPIHNAPQGKSAYASPDEWPAISGQCHWTPGDGSPRIDPPNTLVHDMAHTHAEFDAVPIWAELGNQSITLHVTVQLFHTAGSVGIVQGVYYGQQGQQNIPVVMDTLGPWVGDPNGLVKYHGTMTINLYDAVGPGVGFMVHGWGHVGLFTRTVYVNGDQLDNETVIPFYSVVDPNAPAAPISDEGITLDVKCISVAHNMNEAGIFGIHLTEVRDQLLPILAPFSSPLTLKAFGYNYGFDPGLPQDNPGVAHGTYTLLVDNDFHMGVPGMVNVPATVMDGNIGNFDTLDPLWISQQAAPMGFSPGKHRLTIQWAVRTPDAGWVDQYGNSEPGGLELRSLLSVTTTIGQNPVGCNPTLCPPIPAAASAAPPPPSSSPTQASIWFTVGTVSRHDVQQLMSAPMTPAVPLQFRICQAGDTNCSSPEIDRSPSPPPSPPARGPFWIIVGTANRHDVQQLMSGPITPAVPSQFRICQAGDTNCSSPEIDR